MAIRNLLLFEISFRYFSVFVLDHRYVCYRATKHLDKSQALHIESEIAAVSGISPKSKHRQRMSTMGKVRGMPSILAGLRYWCWTNSYPNHAGRHWSQFRFSLCVDLVSVRFLPWTPSFLSAPRFFGPKQLATVQFCLHVNSMLLNRSRLQWANAAMYWVNIFISPTQHINKGILLRIGGVSTIGNRNQQSYL